ncbi:unnamed protein product, partial [Rotaria magnacalcarata]
MKRSSLILIDRDILLEPSLTERTSITKTTTTTTTTTKRTVSPKASVNQLNISKSMTKTDAEIEHQKYQ